MQAANHVHPTLLGASGNNGGKRITADVGVEFDGSWLKLTMCETRFGCGDCQWWYPEVTICGSCPVSQHQCSEVFQQHPTTYEAAVTKCLTISNACWWQNSMYMDNS